MSEIDVTVVIPAYNPGPFLTEALSSIQAQSYPGWRVLIVDDGSDEDLSRYIPGFMDDLRVALVRHPQNLGQPVALNTALSHVQTPYFVQLDADDWLMPRALEQLRNELGRQPATTALVSGNIFSIHDDGRTPLFRRGRPFKGRYEYLLSNRSVWPRFYRTEALLQVGGWPTDGPYEGRYMEDRRILYRLIERYSFAWLNVTAYLHRRHAGNQTRRVAEYNEVLRWAVRETLARWGNRYRPIFSLSGTGFLYLAWLVPTDRRRGQRRLEGQRPPGVISRGRR